MAQIYMQQMPVYRPQSGPNWMQMGLAISNKLERRRTAREEREIREEKKAKDEDFNEEWANLMRLKTDAKTMSGIDPVTGEKDPKNTTPVNPERASQINSSILNLMENDATKYNQMVQGAATAEETNQRIITAQVDRLSKASDLQLKTLSTFTAYADTFGNRNLRQAEADPLKAWNDYRKMLGTVLGADKNPRMQNMIDADVPQVSTAEEAAAAIPEHLAKNKERQELLRKVAERKKAELEVKTGKVETVQVGTEKVTTRQTLDKEGELVPDELGRGPAFRPETKPDTKKMQADKEKTEKKAKANEAKTVQKERDTIRTDYNDAKDDYRRLLAQAKQLEARVNIVSDAMGVQAGEMAVKAREQAKDVLENARVLAERYVEKGGNRGDLGLKELEEEAEEEKPKEKAETKESSAASNTGWQGPGNYKVAGAPVYIETIEEYKKAKESEEALGGK